MTKKFFTASIIGVGNIGLRYFQALQKIESIKLIRLFEQDLKYLENRIINLSEKPTKDFTKSNSINEDILESDIVIVSTTSSQRYQVSKQLIDLGYRGKIILEKILSPNFKTLIKLEKLLENYDSPIYVNQWMRLTPLIKVLEKEKTNQLIVKGNNMGLLCNSVHYIDLISSFFDIDDFEIDRSNSNILSVIPSKRKGYDEITGKLIWYSSSKNKSLILEDNKKYKNDEDHLYSIGDNFHKEYILIGDELIDISLKRKYKIKYLSELASFYVDQILLEKNTIIPDFKKSLKQHKLVFKALQTILGQEANHIKIT